MDPVKRKLSLVLVSALLVTSMVPVLRAGGIVEGKLTLPLSKPAAKGTARYQPKSAGATIAAPDPTAGAVFIEGLHKPGEGTNTIFQMGQKGFQFAPGLLVVPKGAKVAFPNHDDEYHNVLSYSKAKEFDLGRYRKDEKPPVQVFEKPGLIELNCEIHEHMRGYILVVDSDFFAKSDASGKFRIEGVPPGTYEVKAWLNEKTLVKKTVEVKDGVVAEINFP